MSGDTDLARRAITGGDRSRPIRVIRWAMVVRERTEGWHHGLMDNADAITHEAREIDEVIERLQAKFPTVAEADIRAVVEEEHQAFDGRPIRDFVPVFVERAAAERLRRSAA